MVENTFDNASAWESYWNTVAKSSVPILWNCDPSIAAAIDLSRFQAFVNPELPLIDFGCGDGRQTHFFANHFQSVIGIDVSPSAVEMARANNSAPNIEYHVLDALQPEQANALHSTIGDANVYIKGVMHQISQFDRPNFARSLEFLLGKKGTLYLIDVAPKANAYFASLLQIYREKLPQEIELVLEKGINKGSVTQGDIAAVLPNFEFVADGEDVLHTIHILPDGDNAKIPAYYALLKRR